jgi:hypothetical protein
LRESTPTPSSSPPALDNGAPFLHHVGMTYFHTFVASTDNLYHFRQYSYGCFYWMSDSDEETDMLVLDTRSMEFSIAQPPPQAKSSFGLFRAMVEAGEMRPGMFVLPSDPYAMTYSILQNDGGNSSQWRLEETFSLGANILIGSTPGYLLLHKYGRCFYTLDLKTFKHEKMCDAILYFFFNLNAYSNFPPSFLSWPTIATGKFSVKS